MGAYSKINKTIKNSLNNSTKGLYLHDGKKNALVRLFGCNNCHLRGTDGCPHGIKHGEHHSNGICSDRILYLKEEHKKCGDGVRLIQQEQLFKDKMLTERMIIEYGVTGELDVNYAKLSKNIISNAEKMRRQDEGVKVQADVTMNQEDFRRIIDIQAEKIDKQDNERAKRITQQKV